MMLISLHFTMSERFEGLDESKSNVDGTDEVVMGC